MRILNINSRSGNRSAWKSVAIVVAPIALGVVVCSCSGPSNDPVDKRTGPLLAAAHRAAIDRDRQRLIAARAESRLDTAPAEPAWVTAARHLAVDDLYENQTGPADWFYRDADWLRVESLLRGTRPAELMCAQIIRQSDCLAKAADIALRLSRTLETPEAQRLLAEALWDERHLTQTMQSSVRAVDAVRNWSENWGKTANEIIGANAEGKAKTLLRESYGAAVRASLAAQGWPWKTGCDLMPDPESLAGPDPAIADRARAAKRHQERAQIAAISLAVFAETQSRVAGKVEGLVRLITAQRAEDFLDSMRGPLDVALTLGDSMAIGRKKMITQRTDEFILTPIGAPRVNSEVADLLQGILQSIQARLIDEAEHDSTLRLGGQPVGASAAAQLSPEIGNVNGKLLLNLSGQLLELGLAGGQLGVLVGAIADPEPATKTVLFVLGGGLILWDLAAPFSFYQGSASVRCVLAERFASMWLGSPGHKKCLLPNGTLVAADQVAEVGLVLNLELGIWRELEQRVDAGER